MKLGFLFLHRCEGTKWDFAEKKNEHSDPIAPEKKDKIKGNPENAGKLEKEGK